jgi:hypothetical protein
MMVTVVAANSEKHLEDECLHVDYRMWIACVLRIIPTNVSLGVLYFQGQQIRFVEEKDYGDALKCCVVDYRIKNVLRLFESVRFSKIEIVDINALRMGDGLRLAYRSSAST